MIRALAISLLLAPSAASAEAIACAFTIVCAPEIECEAHEGIPFEITDAGGPSIMIDGQDVAGVRLSDTPLGIAFVADGEILLFTLGEDGQGALSRHLPGAPRLAVSSFLGPCVRA